jgi:hypothetical protein
MHRIKQYCRTAFQLLIIVLLSSCLVVWRLIKHVLDRKMKKEDNEGVKSASIADDRVAPVLSPDVELGNKPIEAEVGVENSVLVLEAVEAYCVKCRQKQPIQGARKVTTKKGRPAIEGTCAVCDKKLFRFIAREKENLSGEG